MTSRHGNEYSKDTDLIGNKLRSVCGLSRNFRELKADNVGRTWNNGVDYSGGRPRVYQNECEITSRAGHVISTNKYVMKRGSNTGGHRVEWDLLKPLDKFTVCLNRTYMIGTSLTLFLVIKGFLSVSLEFFFFSITR